MDKSALFRRTAAILNRAVLPMLHAGPGRHLLGGSMATVSYSGRKSGNQVTFPVNYRREGPKTVVIGVMAADAKTWWRNFTGDGAPMHLRLGSDEYDGHAVAVRGANGSLTVRVTLS